MRDKSQGAVRPILLLSDHLDCIASTTLKMDAQQIDTSAIKRWDAAHECARCCHALRLADMDLRAVTTGIVACPNCDWSGQIEIQIIERGKPEI